MEKLETLKPANSSKFSWIQGPTPEYKEGQLNAKIDFSKS